MASLKAQPPLGSVAEHTGQGAAHGIDDPGQLVVVAAQKPGHGNRRADAGRNGTAAHRGQGARELLDGNGHQVAQGQRADQLFLVQVLFAADDVGRQNGRNAVIAAAPRWT